LVAQAVESAWRDASGVRIGAGSVLEPEALRPADQRASATIAYMFSWFVLAIRAGVLIAVVLGTASRIRSAGGSSATRRYLISMGSVLLASLVFVALIYDDFRLWFWLVHR